MHTFIFSMQFDQHGVINFYFLKNGEIIFMQFSLFKF